MDAAYAKLALALPLLLAALLPHTSAARTPVAQRAAIHEFDLALDAGTQLHYAMTVPEDIAAEESLPLVVGLHFGWRGEQPARLRDDWVVANGPPYPPAELYDAFLSAGSIPPALIRAELLGEEIPERLW